MAENVTTSVIATASGLVGTAFGFALQSMAASAQRLRTQGGAYRRIRARLKLTYTLLIATRNTLITNSGVDYAWTRKTFEDLAAAFITELSGAENLSDDLTYEIARVELNLRILVGHFSDSKKPIGFPAKSSIETTLGLIATVLKDLFGEHGFVENAERRANAELDGGT